MVQTLVAVFLVVALAFHWAAVGSIGLSVIVLATAFTGITQEHRLAHAFQEALPFTALLVVFFGIVAVIRDQALFQPIVDALLALPRESQTPIFFVANGLLSAISDNVFVAAVYINEIATALSSGTIDRDQFDALAHRDQHRNEHSEHCHTEWPSGFPVSTNFRARSIDSIVIPANGRDGFALHVDDDPDGPASGELPALAPTDQTNLQIRAGCERRRGISPS